MGKSKKQEKEEHALMQAFSAQMNTKDRKLLECFIGPKDTWANGWECDDSPDLVREYSDYVVGIEHFEVDGLSRKYEDEDKKKSKKKGKNGYQHLTSRFENKKQTIMGKYVGKINNYTEKEQLEIYGELFHDIYSFCQEYSIQDSGNVIYDMLDSLFTEDNKGHAQKCKTYKEKLEKKFEKPARIGLLVELFGDFTNLALFDGKQYNVNTNGYFPLSKDILWLLSCALLDENLDFIIFYRRFDRTGTGYGLKEKTVLLNKTIDVNMIRSFRGELLYERIPFRRAKKSCTKSETFIRYRENDDMIDILEDGNREETIDLRIFWNVVKKRQNAIKYKHPYYTELELASVIYALCKIPHEWQEVEYIDNSRLENGQIKDDIQKGYSPTKYNSKAFEIQILEFLYWFENKIREIITVDAVSKSKNNMFQKSEDYDISDNSQGEWIHVGKNKK